MREDVSSFISLFFHPYLLLSTTRFSSYRCFVQCDPSQSLSSCACLALGFFCILCCYSSPLIACQQKRGSVTDINVALPTGPNEVGALSAVEGSLGRTGSACASVSDLAILSMRWVTSLREVIYFMLLLYMCHC